MLTLARLYSFLTDYNNKTPISDVKVDAEFDQLIASINIKQKSLATGDSPYTILDTDDYEIWLIDASGGNVSVTFAAAADHENELMWFVRTDATGNAVSVNSVSMTLQYGMEIFYSDGTSWLNIAFPTTLAAHAHLTAGDGGGIVHKFKENRAKFTYNGGVSTGTIKLSSAQYYCKDKFCWWDQELTTTQANGGNPVANDWYYLYLDYSAITGGTEITNVELIWSTTEPAFDQSTRSWLNGDDRCVGACIGNAGGTDFLEFFHEDNLVLYADDIASVLSDSTPSNVFSDITYVAPIFCIKLQVGILGAYVDTNSNLFWRTNGQTGGTGHFIGVVSNGVADRISVITNVITDSTQKIEIRWATASAANSINSWLQGWYFPIGM